MLRLTRLLAASLTPPTLRHASRDMGEQLLALADVWPWAAAHAVRLRPCRRADVPDPWYAAPVFGVLAAAMSATPRRRLGLYLRSVGCRCHQCFGVRGIPIGHTHGQQLLARLREQQLARLATRVWRPRARRGRQFLPRL